MRNEPRLTRRGALAAAAAGGTFLAGCGSLLGSGDSEVRIDASGFATLDEQPSISLPARIPVDVAESHLEAARDRAERLLSSLPHPLGPAEIPNGAIRQEIVEFRDGARSELERAASADTAFERLEALRGARGDARAAAAGWRAIDAGLDHGDLRENVPEIERDLSNLRDRWAYVGDDPVRATLVHAEIEGLADRARRKTDRDREFDGVRQNPVSLGEFARDLEDARASVADAAHLYEQFTASLSNERNLASTIGKARDELAASIEAKRDALPGTPGEPNSLVEADVEESPAGRALDNLWDWVEYMDLEERQPASAVLEAAEGLAGIRALDSLVAAIEDGEDWRVESAEEMRTIRSSALEAFASARTDARHSALTRHLLQNVKYRIRRADRELGGREDEVPAEWLHREIGFYVSARYLAGAIPETARTTASALGE